MRPFFWNVILALGWAAVTGSFTVPNLALGFVLGYLAIIVAGPIVPEPLRERAGYARRWWKVATFALFFLWELIRANVRIAWEVLTPHHQMTPGIVAVPLEDLSNAEITLLANLITLTPGTLSLDVSDNRRVLFIHAMYVEDADAVRREIKEGFERRVMEVMR